MLVSLTSTLNEQKSESVPLFVLCERDSSIKCLFLPQKLAPEGRKYSHSPSRIIFCKKLTQIIYQSPINKPNQRPTTTFNTADDTAHAESVKFLTTDVMKNFNNMADDYHTSQSNLNATGAGLENGAQRGADSHLQQQSQPIHSRSESRQQVGVLDEMSQDLTYLSRDAPLDGGESTFGAATSYSQLAGSELHDQTDDIEAFRRQHLVESPLPGSTHNELLLEQLSPDNVDIRKPMQQAG